MDKFNIKEWKDTQLKGDKTLMESPVKNIAKAIPQNYPYDKLAKDIAAIVMDDYGSHIVKPFLTALTKHLLK